MYKQTLYKVLTNYIKPKVIKRLNRYKKWEYGYLYIQPFNKTIETNHN